MRFIPHIRLLPLLVMVSALSFGIRFGEIVSGKSGGGLALAESTEAPKPSETLLSPPSAENAAAKTPAPMTSGETAAGTKEQVPATAKTPAGKDHATGATPTDAPAETKDKVAATTPEPETSAWKDSGDLDFSESRMELFNDLASRRQDIEKREKEMAMREALLKAAEQELDQKFKELSTLKEEISHLLKQQSAEEEKRITSLVKIYEGMKAKDAARIFDTLDMDVLIQVLGRMSERKSAPIIASMSAERARSLTIMLAEQKRLPGGTGDGGALLPPATP